MRDAERLIREAYEHGLCTAEEIREYYYRKHNPFNSEKTKTELDSMSFKSKKVVGIDLECDNQNCIWALDGDSVDLNHNICGTTEYWKFYKKHISPSMIQSSHIPEQKPIEDAKLLAAQQAQIDYIYAHLINDSVLRHNAYVTPNYLDFRKKHISKQKPPEQFNKKKSTAIVEVAVLIFLLLCLNGAFFWSLIFGLLTH